MARGGGDLAESNRPSPTSLSTPEEATQRRPRRGRRCHIPAELQHTLTAHVNPPHISLRCAPTLAYPLPPTPTRARRSRAPTPPDAEIYLPTLKSRRGDVQSGGGGEGEKEGREGEGAERGRRGEGRQSRRRRVRAKRRARAKVVGRASDYVIRRRRRLRLPLKLVRASGTPSWTAVQDMGARGSILPPSEQRRACKTPGTRVGVGSRDRASAAWNRFKFCVWLADGVASRRAKFGVTDVAAAVRRERRPCKGGGTASGHVPRRVGDVSGSDLLQTLYTPADGRRRPARRV
jgi:hypothetical protein